MRQRRWRGNRRIACLAAAAVALVVGFATYGFGLLDRLELETVDARFAVRGTEAPPDDVILVLVDDVTFDRLDEQWPFPRSMHGQVIDALNRDGATAIAFDVQFTEPTVPKEDKALIDAVDRADAVTLATEEVNARGGSDIFGGEAVLRGVGARAGNSQLASDPGGVLRRLPYSIRGLKGFAVVAHEQRSGEQVSREDFDQNREAWIDYRGPARTIPAVPYSDVLLGSFKPGTFADKTVVLGAAAPTLQDIHPTSVSGDAVMSGAEIQANAIATVAEGLPLRSAPNWLDVLLIGLLGVAIPAISLRIRPLAAFGAGLLLAIGFLAAAQIAFEAGSIWQTVYPLLTLTVASIATLAAHYSLDAVDRIRLRDTFGRFVPAPVIEEALACAGDDLRLNGVRRETTVLFSDLRGFTTLAEGLEPEQVIEMLNHYLTEMSDAIMGHGGTLVAYMGDGIMAIFGAPLEQPDHASRALRAAEEMIGPRLDAFNEWMTRSGTATEPVHMGVGLNSGEVMSGNVGSPNRVEYTAVGDTVNTASRLEGMTKGTGHSLFVAASTRALVVADGSDELILVGEMDVRGRSRKLEVWGLASGGEEAMPEPPLELPLSPTLDAVADGSTEAPS